jgi:hypothetical protein
MIRLNKFTVTAFIVCLLVSITVGIVLRQSSRREATYVDAKLAQLGDSDLLTQIPFLRESCILIEIGIGMQRERIEVDGGIVKSDELEAFLESKIDESGKDVKAIVFSVGISASSPFTAETTVRNVAKRRSVEFVRFNENSKKSLSFRE